MTATLLLASPLAPCGLPTHFTAPVPTTSACGQGAPLARLTTLPGWVTCVECQLILQRAAELAAAGPCHNGSPKPENCSCFISGPCWVCLTSEYCPTCGESYFPESEHL